MQVQARHHRHHNRKMRVLGSDMRLVASSFYQNYKSTEALAACNQVLGKEIDVQKSKIEPLSAALDNAPTSFGENNSRTKNWQIQLNNTGAELNKLKSELKANSNTFSSFEDDAKCPARAQAT